MRAIPTKERRRGKREALSASLPVLFGTCPEDEQIAHANLVDVSASGARFRLATPVPAGAWLMFNHYKAQISGRGRVRYCRRVKGMYEIGVEFAGGTGWDAAKQRLRKALFSAEADVEYLHHHETGAGDPSTIQTIR